jgi:hypothetical protein
MRNDMAIIETHLRKAQKKRRNCFEYACTERAIDSHILQKNGIISMIAEKGHVIECVIDPFQKDYKLKFKRTGINDVFTFKGFCNTHDDQLFKEIEKSDFDLSNYHHQLLFAYRTSVNETRKKEIIIDGYDSIKSDPNSNVPGWYIDETILGQLMGIKDGEYTRDLLYKNIKSTNTRDFIFYNFELAPVEICICGVYTFETSAEIKKMEIELDPKFLEPLTDVFITLLPHKNKSILSIGFQRDHNKTCDQIYGKLFRNGDHAAIIQHISDLILLQVENWIVSETFYHKKIKGKENAIKSIINWAQQNLNERISLDFNLFK